MISHMSSQKHSNPNYRDAHSPTFFLPTVDGIEDNKTSNLTTGNNASDINLRTLYPAISCNNNGTIQLDSGHRLYYEEYGNNTKNKKTALSLHGGPGAGCFPNHARFFDPDLYGRIILYDQRGCGRSKPQKSSVNDTDIASLITQNNTLSLLVDDIETLRLTLGIEKWDVVLGGSWGSTLALAYSQRYPERVASIVLRGVCLFRDEEIDWLFSNKIDENVFGKGALANLNTPGWKIFEEFTQKYLKELHSSTPNQCNDLKMGSTYTNSPSTHQRYTLHSYYDCLLGNDPVIRFLAAKSWFQWEMAAGSFHKQGQQQPQQNLNHSHHQIGNYDMLEWIPSSGIWTLSNSSENKTTLIDNTSDIFNVIRKWSTQDDIYFEQKPNLSNFTEESLLHDNIIKPVKSGLSNVDVSKYGANLTKEQIEFASTFIPAQAILTCFYSVNNRKMTEDAGFNLLSLVDKVRHIPCIAVQGGKDFICPPDTALDLNKLWPDMSLRIPLEAGHSMYDPFITHELIEATDHFGKQNNN